MPRIKYQKNVIGGVEKCFYDEVEQRYYQRICADFVPPANRQGALVSQMIYAIICDCPFIAGI